jgi:hypothetical protein
MVLFRAQKVTKAWRRFRSETKGFANQQTGHGNAGKAPLNGAVSPGSETLVAGGCACDQSGGVVSQGTFPGRRTACIVVAVLRGAGGGIFGRTMRPRGVSSTMAPFSATSPAQEGHHRRARDLPPLVDRHLAPRQKPLGAQRFLHVHVHDDQIGIHPGAMAPFRSDRPKVRAGAPAMTRTT